MQTYQDADRYLGSKDDRPLPARATRIHRRSVDTIAVRYHATDVVTYHADGSITLTSGGWRSLTTKARMVEYAPVRLYADKGEWYIGSRRDKATSLYYDGIILEADGTPRTPKYKTQTDAARKRAFDRAVTAYIEGFVGMINAGSLATPGKGDCWGCLFQVTDAPAVTQGPMRRQRSTPHGRVEPMGVGHYVSHLTEAYYVPSLLWNAITSRGYGDPVVVYEMIRSRADGKWAGLILRGYFRDLKPALYPEWIAAQASAVAR